MLELRATSLFRQHLLIAGIMESVYDFERAPSERIYELIGELQCIKKQCEPSIEDPVASLCEEVQERLAWATSGAYPLTPKDREMILAACDELRVLLIGSSLAGARAARAGQSFLEARLLRERDAAAVSITHGRGGITYGRFPGCCVIVFPRLRSDDQWSEVFDELLSIYEQKASGENWLIDLSLLDAVPALFLANLTAYAGRLQAEGDDIGLAWLRDGLLEDAQLERATTFFSLELFDGFYFTRSRRAAGGQLSSHRSPRLSQ